MNSAAAGRDNYETVAESQAIGGSNAEHRAGVATNESESQTERI